LPRPGSVFRRQAPRPSVTSLSRATTISATIAKMMHSTRWIFSEALIVNSRQAVEVQSLYCSSINTRTPCAARLWRRYFAPKTEA
jgi:hypothetical protein